MTISPRVRDPQGLTPHREAHPATMSEKPREPSRGGCGQVWGLADLLQGRVIHHSFRGTLGVMGRV